MRFVVSTIILHLYFFTVVTGTARHPDTLLLKASLSKADKYFSQGRYDSAEYYLVKVGAIAQQKKLPVYTLQYTAQYARLLFKQLRYSDALAVSQLQLKVAMAAKNVKAMANAYNNIAIQYRVMGKLDLASSNLMKALDLSRRLKDLVLERRFDTNLASIFLDLKDKQNSLHYARRSYDIAVRLKDSALIALSIPNLSISEVENNRYDDAIVHLNQLLRIAEKQEDYSAIADACLNLGDVNVNLKRYSKALQYYGRSMSILKRHPNPDSEMYTMFGLAGCFSELKDYETAKRYFLESLRIAKTSMPRNDLKELYILGSNISEHLHRPADALKYYKHYSAIKDSVLTATSDSVVHQLNIKYQTSLKEQAIDRQKLQLSEQNSQLQRSRKHAAFSVAALIFLSAVSLVVYLVLRNRNQSIQLSLLKSQIHPHFLFNTLNNLYALSLKKSDESPAVVLGLAEILKYILYECNSPRIELQKEIEVIRRYISLERVRYAENLEINISTEGDISGFYIVPLLLLPLVENAFKHGISKVEDEGWISIDIRMNKGNLIFKIANNKAVTRSADKASSGYGNIGLYNIRKRLNILYRNRHSMEIFNEEEIFMVLLKINLNRRPIIIPK